MSAKHELTGVQYLRGVAVTLVVFDHVEGMLAMPKYFGTQVAAGLFSAGTIGVDLFFVISGLIIYYVTGGIDSKEISARDFAIRRFCRIMPFAWICIIGHFLSRQLVAGHIDSVPYLRALVLYPVGDIHPDQVWTLRHEAFFYAAAGIALLGRPGRLILGVFLVAPIVWAIADPSSATLPEGSTWLSEIFSLRSNVGFALGMVLGYCHARWGHSFLPKSLGVAAVVVSPVLLLAVGYVAARHQLDAPLLFAIGISLICFCLVLASLALPAASGIVGRFASLLGAASFSIYLTHSALISFVASLLVRVHVTSVVLGSCLTVVVVLLVGILIHLTVEQRVVRYARAWLEPAPAKKVVAAT